MNISNKGAMFGLDARIALAIFGALSVISGAALYSAIQQAKATAYLTEMNEVIKAYESYYLDTGSQLPAKDATWLKVRDLIENNGVAGWNGPYLPYEVDSDTFLKAPNFPTGTLSIPTFADTDFGDGTIASACTATNCHAYIYTGGYNLNISEAIDQMVDSQVNHLSGKIRIYKTTPEKNIYYKFFDREL